MRYVRNTMYTGNDEVEGLDRVVKKIKLLLNS